MQGKLTQNISSLTKLFSCQGCFCKYYLAAIYDNFRETIPRQKLSNQFSLIIKHTYWATNENKVIFNPRCFLFHFWSITRSSIVCNFTNEWKLLVSRGGSRFSFCYIVMGETNLGFGGCGFTHVGPIYLLIKSSLMWQPMSV